MGHTRLTGSLPDTRPWRNVVENVAEGESLDAVATATMAAADRGLAIAAEDAGLQKVVLLIAKIPLAAKAENFAEALADAGIQVRGNPSLFEIIAGLSDAVDRATPTTAPRSDISELAQAAAVESITALSSQRTRSLFGATPEDIQQALGSLGTKKGFSVLAHDFFSRFSQRFLTYHLSRELSNHVGLNQRFASPQEHSGFLRDLDTHCRQSCLILKEFAGAWHSKTNYETGITPRKAANFARAAVKKLRAEYKIRGARDAK
jgi:hypothetical protein